MFSIAQSTFLQALGRAIGHSLWQIAAFWLIYTAVSSIGKLSANRRYQLAAGFSLTGFAWFIGTLVYMYTTVPLRQSSNTVYIETTAEAGKSFPGNLLYLYHSISESVQSLAPYISCAYLLMFVLLSIRLNNGFKQVKFFATEGLEKTNVEWRLFVQRHAAALGISRRVNIFVSQHVESPLTLGFWKPIILLPVASLNHLTVAQVESILLHELAHIRRHDYLVNIFLQIAEISLFFNPFMRLLLNQVKQERENSCDDYVLQFQYSPKDYAKALLAIEHSNNMVLLAMAAKGNQSFQLLNRVKRMVAPQPKAFNYRQQLAVLLLFTLLMLGFTVIVPRPKPPADAIAIAAAEKAPAEKKVLPPIPAELPVDIAAPPVQEYNVIKGYDVVRNLTRNAPAAERLLNVEKTIAVTDEEIELHTAHLKALGKEIQVKVKPLTDQITAWANGTSDIYETALTADHLQALQIFDIFKDQSVEKITEISEDHLKRLMAKNNHLFKAVPFTHSIAARNNSATAYTRQAKNKILQVTEIKEKLPVAGRAEYVRQQADKQNIVFREVRTAINGKLSELKVLQEQAKQLESVAKMQRLHLGLLPNDCDTFNAEEGEAVIAKLQAHKPQPYTMHFKATPSSAIPTEIRINGKHPGKCVITVTENNVKVASEKEPSESTYYNINGQNIDIRHETQINNGKAEKVVIISISSS